MIYITLLLLGVFFMLILFFKLRNNSNIPQPFGWPYFRHYFYFWRKDHLNVYAELAKKYFQHGLFQIHIHTVPEHVVLVDPELPKYVLTRPELFARSDLLNKSAPFFKKGLLMATGKEHAWQRKVLGRAFTPQNLRMYAKIMGKHADVLIEKWNTKINDQQDNGVNIEVLDDLKTFSFSIISESALSYEAKEDDCNFPTLCESLFLSSDSNAAILFSLFPFLKWLPFSAGNERQKALREVEKFVWKIIAQRKEDIENKELSEKKRYDFLSLMIQTKEEERKMTDEHIRDNIFTFVIGGFETISTGLMWTLYALGIYPEIQRKAREEIKAVLADKNEEITVDHLSKLEYVENVIKEVLRVYNSSIRVGRVATQDCKLGGYSIPKGRMIKTVFNLFHMNEELFPQPEQFNPERFSDPKNIKPGSWLAFGYGSYSCIGKKFAMNEIKLGVAKILQNFELAVDMDKRSFKRSIRISVCANPPVIVRIKPLKKNYEKKNN